MGDSSLRSSATHWQHTGLTVIAISLAFGMLIPNAAAQLTTGTLFGTVQDSQAAAVPGVIISLISENRGTRLPAAVSSAGGDFVFPNVPPDTYTLEIAHKGFKTLRRTGIAVSPGDRTGLGALTIEVGAVTESVTVTAETALLQTQSAERSFTITTTEVKNLPISNRSFTSLASLTPGVDGTSRIGDRANSGGSDTNVMMDGVSTMDTGNNGTIVSVNTESVEEVKILVSNYQAEYGRSSGLQISSVTKSGTNTFHGSAFLIMRRSNWNAWNKSAKLNGDSRTSFKERDLGYSDRRADRKAGRQQQAVLLLQPGVRPAHNGRQHCTVPLADGARARRATSRRQPTTTAIRFRTSRIR